MRLRHQMARVVMSSEREELAISMSVVVVFVR